MNIHVPELEIFFLIIAIIAFLISLIVAYKNNGLKGAFSLIIFVIVTILVISLLFFGLAQA